MKKLKFDRTTMFWTAITSGVLLLLKQIAELVGFTITDELVGQISAITATVMSLLVILGVLTNSDEATKFEEKIKFEEKLKNKE